MSVPASSTSVRPCSTWSACGVASGASGMGVTTSVTSAVEVASPSLASKVKASGPK